jgi:integrase
LSSTALEALRAHRAHQLEERLAAGVAWRDEDLVFCTPIGGALCGNHFLERDFQALLAHAELPRIRFHDLRHTCATLLLRRGVHPKVVSELLGHSTVTMTLDRFARPARHAAGSYGGNGWHSRLTVRGTSTGTRRGFSLELRSALQSNGQNGDGNGAKG